MWDPVDKKVFQSRDIIFMEDKTLADWESEKKIKNSDEIRSQPTESRLTLEDPACHGQDTVPVAEEAEEAEIGTDQDPESDSDEEEILEPKKLRKLKKALNRTFAMKDMGPARQILGMQ